MARPMPDAFICPITQDVMDVPVCAPDGRSYEQVGEGITTPPTILPCTNEHVCSWGPSAFVCAL
jgi:hypothetical protein